MDSEMHASSTRQTPKISELGEAGEVRQSYGIEVADVGLVGFQRCWVVDVLSGFFFSNARPEIANYGATLTPNLEWLMLTMDRF